MLNIFLVMTALSNKLWLISIVDKMQIRKTKDITYDCWFQIDEYSARYMLASTSFTEEGIKRIVATSNRLIWGHLPVRLDAMLKTVKFPTGVANLYSRLSAMYRYYFTLNKTKLQSNKQKKYRIKPPTPLLPLSYNWPLVSCSPIIT